MKNYFYYSLLSLICITSSLSAQVDIQPTAIGVNVCNPVSKIAVNDVGIATNTVHVKSLDNVSGSAAIFGTAFDLSTSSGFSNGVFGQALFGGTSNRAVGLRGDAQRDTNYSSGRSYGVRSTAGFSTPGANYGILSILVGGNAGAAVVGYDQINQSGWSQVMPSTVSYAGYFRGKGYFHDYVGIGEEDPQSQLHVSGGDVFVEGSINGVILDSGTGCFKITVDGTGALITTSVPCP